MQMILSHEAKENKTKLFSPIIIINFVNIKQESLCCVQQNFASFGFFVFCKLVE